MKVHNVHERRLRRPASEVGALIDTLSSRNDRLWPHETWPPMRLDRPLAVGATGGHGPVRYRVCAYEPGRRLCLTFESPRGFDGYHEFEAVPAGSRTCVLRHTLTMTARGGARVTWPVVYRPLHDALIEDSLHKAETQLGGSQPRARRWSWYVRLLRSVLKHIVPRPPATVAAEATPRAAGADTTAAPDTAKNTRRRRRGGAPRSASIILVVAAVLFWQARPDDAPAANVRQQQDVPASIKALDALPSDYLDVFAVSVPNASAHTPEQWARAVMEGASRTGREVAWRGVLGLRLAPAGTRGHVAGWRIVDQEDDWIRLQSRSWCVTANVVVRVENERVLLATLIRYDVAVARLVWAPLSVAHRRAVPGLLGGAVGRVDTAGSGASPAAG